jgi:hypothetical protein
MSLIGYETSSHGWTATSDVHWTRRLEPRGKVRPFPDYIPKSLLSDYEEACLIRDLSPKAAATLARRCLQGMIRDFAGIKVKGNRLVDEIKELHRLVNEGAGPRGVTEDSIAAIDAVRDIGNIGAHMEHDVNFIVDVQPDEAQVLIELVESLFDDWYVESHKREQRFAKTIGLAAAKKAERAAAKGAATPKPIDETRNV